MRKQLNKLALLSIAFLLCFSLLSTAKAYTIAFSYEGWEIKNLPSQNSTTISSSQMVRVRHTQERDKPYLNGSMYVSVERRNWLGVFTTYKTSSLFDGEWSGAWYVHLADSGTYRLRFTRDLNTSPETQSFYVKGDFSKKIRLAPVPKTIKFIQRGLYVL